MTNTIKITAIALDPIYIGTGGYTIGRVDNTIVRDPITNLPKIPGSSLAWTWRYYCALKLIDNFDESKQCECYKNGSDSECNNWKEYWWCGSPKNLKPSIKCAGQDEDPNKQYWEKTSWHCWHCIVCHSFWFSKKDLSYQWRLFFSDLNIFAFPVNTYRWIYWIINPEFVNDEKLPSTGKIKVSNLDNGYLNLWYLNLEIEGKEEKLENVLIEEYKNNIDKLDEKITKNFVLVDKSLFSQIVNANLEVRTSVSIDPITGAAKEWALFTSEAIPRLTVFVGEIRFKNPLPDDKIAPKLTFELIEEMLNDTKDLFEAFGIWGMTTRGFGRLKIDLLNEKGEISKNGAQSAN